MLIAPDTILESRRNHSLTSWLTLHIKRDDFIVPTPGNEMAKLNRVSFDVVVVAWVVPFPVCA